MRPVVAYWCAMGTSGTTSPTCLASCAPQKPAQHTTTSAGSTPSAVRTPVTFLPSSTTPSTSVFARNLAPRAIAASAWACTARTALTKPSVGVWNPPRMRSASTSGCSSAHWPAVSRSPGIPQDCAHPALRCRSAQRSGVVATSRPPVGLKAQPPAGSSPPNLATVYFANSDMVFDGLV